MPELKEDGFSLADYCDQFVDKLQKLLMMIR